MSDGNHVYSDWGGKHTHPPGVNVTRDCDACVVIIEGRACTRCGHFVADHAISPTAVVQDPADERARRLCTVDGCECPNYEKWTRP